MTLTMAKCIYTKHGQMFKTLYKQPYQSRYSASLVHQFLWTHLSISHCPRPSIFYPRMLFIIPIFNVIWPFVQSHFRNWQAFVHSHFRNWWVFVQLHFRNAPPTQVAELDKDISSTLTNCIPERIKKAYVIIPKPIHFLSKKQLHHSMEFSRSKKTHTHTHYEHVCSC